MSLRVDRAASDANRHAVWVQVAERMRKEHVDQGWRHQLFRLFRGVFETNSSLSAEGGFLFNWIAENYVDASLMLVRRELDVQAGTENLRNLPEDIAEHPGVLTRARYLAQWGESTHGVADHAFDLFQPVRIAGSPQADHINPVRVRSDLEAAVAAGDRVRVFAERTRAHRTPEQGIDRSITVRDLHQAIAELREIVGKYYALLTQSVVSEWEPVAQYDTISPFLQPWVTDVRAVARAADTDDREP